MPYSSRFGLSMQSPAIMRIRPGMLSAGKFIWGNEPTFRWRCLMPTHER